VTAGAIFKTAAVLTAALGLTLATVALAPALSTRPYIPDPVEFELAASSPPAGAAASRSKRVRSAVVKTGKRFNLVGLRWKGAGISSLALRVGSGRGWGRWTAVPTDSDDAPDRGAGEAQRGFRVSAPFWAGEGDRLQYRLRSRGPIRDLRLHFINTKGTATALDRLRSKVRRAANVAVGAVATVLGLGSAHAQSGEPAIIGRDAWGASKCPPRATPSYGEVKFAFVHHTVTTNDYQPGDSAAMVLGICLYHRNSNGWNDIGYNFLVDKSGQIFEGRAGGVDAPVVGAQAQGYNSQSTGVSNLGTFSTTGQTEPALQALSRLLAWKLAVSGVPSTGSVTVTSGGGSSNRYPAGTPVTLPRIAGHRDADATACPGDGLYAQLPRLREMVASATLPPAPKLTLEAATRHVTFGGKVSLGASLLAPGGAPLAARPLELQALGRNGWHTAQSLTTDASGTIDTKLRLAYNHAVRALFAGEQGLSGTRSSPISIGVRPLVQARLDPAASAVVPRRARVTITGSVRPHKASAILIASRITPAGRSLRVLRKAVRVRSGKASASVRFTRSGSYAIRLAVPSDRRNLSARSSPLTVKVR
jgi:hypothetical protein